MNTQVLGISVDSVDCLRAWAESLGGITYPLLSDFWPHGDVAKQYGVLRQEGYSERAIFVIDKTGVIRYVDVHKIDEQPNNDELFRVLAQIDPPAAAQARTAPQTATQTAPASAPASDVILYCTPWCPACRRARNFFKDHNIAYAEVDISRDRAAAQKVRGWANGNETTPTIDVRGTIIVDWSEAKLKQALGIK